MEHNTAPISEEERRAIEVHKWYLSQRAGRDVGWEAAVEDWTQAHQAEWRALYRKQHFLDNTAQAREIRDYIWIRSEQAGMDVSQQAEEEWVRLYASEWRDKAARKLRKDLDELRAMKLEAEAGNCEDPIGARCRTITVRIEKGLHVRPSMELKKLIDQCDQCQVYVHNLATNGGAIRITDMMDILSLGAICGDVLVFGVMGPDADTVLDAIEALFDDLARRHF